MSMKIMPREQACDDGECPEFGTPWRGFLPCPKLIEPQALTFHCVPPYENDLPLWFSSYSNSTLPGFVRDSKRAQKESGNSDKNIRLSVSIVYEIRWDENAGLRRDAVRSQVIDVLEAQEIKETGNEEG